MVTSFTVGRTASLAVCLGSGGAGRFLNAMNVDWIPKKRKASGMAEGIAHIRYRDISNILKAGELAIRNRDKSGAKRSAKQLERLGAFADAWRLMSAATQQEWAGGQDADVWNGQPLSGKRLLINNRSRHVGPQIRMARFLGLAAERAEHVVAVTESRLVSIIGRSFPDVDVRAATDQLNLPPFDFVASDERLAHHFCPERADLIKAFRPLLADSGRVSVIRRRIADCRPVIGVTWFSSNDRKVLPSPDHWAEFIRCFDGEFLSLQYDELKNGYDTLNFLSLGKLERLPFIDHFTDLEGHCAAIASVDAIVTISNTTAHLAGSMGVPSVVILDDEVGLAWPAEGTSTPLYPRTTLVRKNNRPWPHVFSEAAREVARILAN